MLEDTNFWTEEANSTLVWRTLDGFPEDQFHDAMQRAKSWLVLLPDVQQVDLKCTRTGLTDVAVSQQLAKDAETIFYTKDNRELEVRTATRRELHIETLKLICGRGLDYSKGLGFIVAFLQMLLSPEDTIRVVLALHGSAKHNAGYFQSQSESFAGDAAMLGKLVEEQLPAVGAHLAKLRVLPTVYADCWFTSIAVNVLPLRDLMDYFEAYFQYGFEFLVTFGLEFLREFSPEILAETDATDVYALLRMEDRYREWKFPAQLRQGLFERLTSIISRTIESIGSGSLGGEERLEEMRKRAIKDLNGRGDANSQVDPCNVPIVDSDSDGL